MMEVEKTGCADGLGVGCREERTLCSSDQMKYASLETVTPRSPVDRIFSTIVPADHLVYSPAVPTRPGRHTMSPDHHSAVSTVTVASEI